MEIGKLHWDGKNNYEKDQMEANNSIAIETQGLARDLFVLHLDVVGEQIKEVEAADPEEGKNLGEMSDEEVIDRSEERRVGRECRTRGSSYTGKTWGKRWAGRVT